VSGWFRFQDIFQFFPLPSDAPRPQFLLADHPFILEFKYQSSSSASISIQREQRIGREIELICSALLFPKVWSIGSQTQYRWTFEITADGNPISKFRQEGYVWRDAIIETNDFSQPGDLSSIAIVDNQTYYSRRGLSPGQDLDIPEDFVPLLTVFWRLTPADRDRALRASYWFQHAKLVSSVSSSAAFIALVSAVEALIPPSGPAAVCKDCGQLTGAGPTKRFVEFVEDHLPEGAIPKRDRRRFYRLRSALTHGGRLLMTDHKGWGFTPNSIRENQDITMLRQIVHFVFHNWLLAKGGKSIVG
jgi:hypothetical protein